MEGLGSAQEYIRTGEILGGYANKNTGLHIDDTKHAGPALSFPNRLQS
jgi:hypothetical protein